MQGRSGEVGLTAGAELIENPSILAPASILMNSKTGNDWFDIRAIKAISSHLSAILPALVGTKMIGVVTDWCVVDRLTRAWFDQFDNYLLLALGFLCAYKLIREIWPEEWSRKKRRRNGGSFYFMVA